MSSNYSYALDRWDATFLDTLAQTTVSSPIQQQMAPQQDHPMREPDILADEGTLTADSPSDANPLGKQITENSMAGSEEVERRASSDQAARSLRRLLRQLEQVEGIFASETAEGITVSIITNNPSLDHRRAIYAREWDLMQSYPGTGFDFHLIDRRDRPLFDVVSLDDSDVYLRM